MAGRKGKRKRQPAPEGRWKTINRPPQDTPAPTGTWVRSDDPLPSDKNQLIAQIKHLAAVRRKEAAEHPLGHACDACKIRRAA